MIKSHFKFGKYGNRAGHEKRALVNTVFYLTKTHVQVHAANTPDTVGGCPIFQKTLENYPTLKGVGADAGYRKTIEEFVETVCKKTIENSE
jgi:hypothetical protein